MQVGGGGEILGSSDRLDDACCVGPFGIGLPDAAAATALVAAKKAWDAGGDADAFARAKVKVLAGGG